MRRVKRERRMKNIEKRAQSKERTAGLNPRCVIHLFPQIGIDAGQILSYYCVNPWRRFRFCTARVK